MQKWVLWDKIWIQLGLSLHSLNKFYVEDSMVSTLPTLSLIHQKLC